MLKTDLEKCTYRLIPKIIQVGGFSLSLVSLLLQIDKIVSLKVTTEEFDN